MFLQSIINVFVNDTLRRAGRREGGKEIGGRKEEEKERKRKKGRGR